MSRVAVLMGGLSAEREVSLLSGAAVAVALAELGHEVRAVDVGEALVEQVAALRGRVDAVFIMLHGRLGEDGTVQGLLELLGIPYTGSGVMSSAMAMNKYLSKQMMRFHHIPVAEDVMVTAEETARRGAETVAKDVERRLGLPCMVKPNCEGSSAGASRVHDRGELARAIREAHAYDRLVMVERYIEGREVTVGLLGERPLALPVLEVLPSKDYYDYECKYTHGMTEYIVPAPMPEEAARGLQELSLAAHEALGCEGFSRVDFMLDAEGRPYCLEVNTIPGMTEFSLVPKAAAAAGYSFAQVVEMVLATAALKVGRGMACRGG